MLRTGFDTLSSLAIALARELSQVVAGSKMLTKYSVVAEIEDVVNSCPVKIDEPEKSSVYHLYSWPPVAPVALSFTVPGVHRLADTGFGANGGSAVQYCYV